jgi:hypothetical protein
MQRWQLCWEPATSSRQPGIIPVLHWLTICDRHCSFLCSEVQWFPPRAISEAQIVPGASPFQFGISLPIVFVVRTCANASVPSVDVALESGPPPQACDSTRLHSSRPRMMVGPASQASEEDALGNSMTLCSVPRHRLLASVEREEFGLFGIPT